MNHQSAIGILVVVGIGLLAASPDAQGPPAPLLSLEAVVEAAANYVRGYQRELTAVLADEEYEQQIVTQTPRDEAMPRVRRLRSEVFFMFAPASGDWMAMRDVLKVEGRDVANRPNLREALRTLPSVEVARTFKAYNSRFNLGRMSRNFNEPTLSLLLLDDRYRSQVTFVRKRIQTRRDGTWVTIEFAERAGTQTLIRDLSLNPAVSKGEFVVEAGTGRIRQARMTTAIGAGTAELTTDYAPDGKLGMWVPVRFSEHYVSGARVQNALDPRTGLQTAFEEIRCNATYANYRRFEVKVIIK